MPAAMAPPISGPQSFAAKTEADYHESNRHNGFAKQVCWKIADRRLGAENRQLRTRIGRLLPVREVHQPYQSRAGKSTKHLCCAKQANTRPTARERSYRQRDCRVNVSAGTSAGDRRADARDHRHAPRGGDHDPAGVFPFGFFQQNIGDNTVAQQNEHHCAHKFSPEWSVHPAPFCARILNHYSTQSKQRVTAFFQK